MQRGLQVFARTLLWLASLLIVVSCGSGAVGPVVNDPGKVTILPGAEGTPVILYSGLPTTFTITGGTGSYVISSSNQAVVQVSGPLNGSALTIIPSPVVTETTLTLTARDTGTALPATATLTVRPGTVSNTITVTPGSSACAPAVCSGGDAVITTTISQGGIPLPARGVRFDVLSGDFRFITSPAGAPETLDLSVTTVTDETGAARVKIRVLSTAPNQVGILQITDLGSGAYQRLTFFIAQASSTATGFFAVPSSVTYTGPDNTRCASGITTDVFVFGGTPPYVVSNTAPSAFTISNVVVGGSGGRFSVTPTGVCADNAAIAITDTAGRTTTISFSNKLGTAAPPPSPMVVAPSSVTLDSCTAIATAVAAGGSGTYSAGAASSLISATVSGSLVSIQRVTGTPAASTNPFTTSVTVTDGTTVTTVSVTLRGSGAGAC